MNIVRRIADRVLDVDVRTAYGAPTELAGRTLVPVAVVTHAFGGGGEAGSAEADGAGGGGGWTLVWPVGAYVGDDAGVRFRGNPVLWGVVATPLVLAAGVSAALVVRSVRR